MRNAIIQALKTGLMVLVVAGLAVSGLALAQVGDDPDPATAVPIQSPAESQAQPQDEAAGETGLDERPLRCGHRFHGAGDLLGIAAESIGIEPADLAEQLREDGATIASVAAANGSAGDAVIEALVDDFAGRLADAVADQRLTQEEADRKLAEATERIAEAVETENPRVRGFGHGGRHFGLGGNVEAVAETLGLSVEELREARDEGATLAELAAQRGFAVDDLVAVIVAPLQERLADAVADERLTQEEADRKLAEATARIAEFVESGERPEGFGRPGHRRGPGRGFGGAGLGTGPAAGQGVADA